MNDTHFESFRAAAPAAADPAALDRVRQRVRDLTASRRPASVVRRVAPAAVLVAVAAALIVGAVAVLTPGVNDAAFARRRAVAALLPRDGVLHTRSTFVVGPTDPSDRKAMPARSWVAEDWVDAAQKASRSEMRSAEDGRLSELTLQVGGVVRSLGRDGGYDEKTRTFVPGPWRLVQYDAPDDVTSPGGQLVDMLREGLDSGEAQVVDVAEFTGEEYWIVQMVRASRDPGTGRSRVTVRATMRKGDYALRELSMRTESDHPVDGKSDETVSSRFSEWERVAPETLPQGFFELGAVDRAAPKGTIVDAPPPPRSD